LQVIRKWKPDIIHVHFAVPAGAAALALHKLTKVPYVLTAHLGDVPGGVPNKTDKWFRWVLPFTRPIWKNAGEVVAVSQFTSSLVEKTYGIHPLIIPNGFDVSTYFRGKLEIHNPPRIIFVGRFTVQKNILELLEILDTVRDLAWNSILLGDGPIREEIERKINQLSMTERFTLPGWVPSEQVQDYLMKSDILFMPSLSEGLPVAGIQALAAGLAIVAYRVGGFNEIVDKNRNGFLSEPGDREGLSAALRNYLVDGKKLLTARKSSLDIAKRFDINRIVEQYSTILKKASHEC
jgi:glycosyltransferase involved in cell wall biosynthesis